MGISYTRKILPFRFCNVSSHFVHSAFDGSSLVNVPIISALDGYGGWSRDGCRTIETTNGRVTCSCDHLTNFAVLFNPDVQIVYEPETNLYNHQLALSYISYIGCGLSLAGILVTIITLLLFKYV